MSDPYEIRYAAAAVEDITALRIFDQRLILGTIETHLKHEPKRVSRSRIKLMTQPFWSQYRLRIGNFRAYYDLDDAARVVNVLRVVEKGAGQTLEQPDEKDQRDGTDAAGGSAP